MNIQNNVPKNSTNMNIDTLIDEINKQRCCVFIGSGLSRDAHFPSWNELVEQIQNQVSKILNRCIRLENDTENSDHIESLRGMISDDEFWSILFDIFQPGGIHHPFVPYHLDLCQIPWLSFITTNYDYCIENASTRIGKHFTSQYFPELNITNIREGQIYHIHGIIDRLKPELSKLSTIISSRDYEKAYSSNTNLPRFLATLSEFYSLVFLGYSLSDKDLNRIIHETQLEIRSRSQIESQSGWGNRRTINNFIVIHEASSINLDAIKELGLIPVILDNAVYLREALYGFLSHVRARTTNIKFLPPDINREPFED